MLRSIVLAIVSIAASLPAAAQNQPGQPGVVTSGSGNVTVGGKPAARQGDTVDGDKVIVGGSSNVFINGKPAATVGDATNCGGQTVTGSRGIFINGKPMVRSGDQTSGCAK